MKILVADQSTLTILGMSTIAKECQRHIEVFEARNLIDVLHILKSENIDHLFLSTVLFEKKDELRTLRTNYTTKVYLMVTKSSKVSIYRDLIPHTIDGIIDMGDDFDKNRKQLEDIITANRNA